MAFLLNAEEFKQALPPTGPLLGIDPGKKRVGLALSDASRMISAPFKTITRGKLTQMIAYLGRLITQEEIVGIVMGLPLEMDGHFGPAAQAAKDWAAILGEHLKRPICMWDERLSSQIMEDFLIHEANLSRRRRFEVIDKMAASYILRSFLENDAGSSTRKKVLSP